MFNYQMVADRSGWIPVLERFGSPGLQAGLILESPESPPAWLEADVVGRLGVEGVFDLIVKTYQFFAIDQHRSMFLWQDSVGAPIERWVWFDRLYIDRRHGTCPEGHRMHSSPIHNGVFGGSYRDGFDKVAQWFCGEVEQRLSENGSDMPVFSSGGVQLGLCSQRCGWLWFENGFAAHPVRAARWLDHPDAQIPFEFRPPFEQDT